MKKISVLFVLILSLSKGYSQYNSFGGAGGFNFGYSFLNTNSINEILPAHFKLNNNFISLGGDGYGMYKRYVFGGSGFGLFGPGAHTDSSLVSFNGAGGFFNFGYAVYNTPRFKLIPMLGIGGMGMRLKLSQSKDLTLQDIQNTPLNETELSWKNFVFELGLNVEYIIRKTEADDSKGLRIGLKIGYTVSPASDNWKYAGGSVSGVPKYMVNGFFARLVVGGAFFKNLKIEKK